MNILFYSPDVMTREGMSSLAARQEGITLEVAGTTAQVESLLNLTTGDLPVLVLDDDGPAAHSSSVMALLKRYPRLRVILYVRDMCVEAANFAISCGIRSIVDHSMSADRIFEAFRTVNRGDQWFDRELLQRIVVHKPYKLTKREGQLMVLLGRGYKNKEIGAALDISEGTVKVYLSRLFDKLDVKDRFELGLVALRNFGTNWDVNHQCPRLVTVITAEAA